MFLLVSDHLGNPGQNPESHKRAVVCVWLCIFMCFICDDNYIINKLH